jgi:glutathione S-transferase
MRLYDSAISGNSYKVRLCAAQLGVPLEVVPVDILRGESRTPEFLRLNPNGRTPLVEDDGFVLAESNAMLCYLADGTKYFPADPWQRALVLQWMFFEQYSHEPCVAVARFICGWLPSDTPRRAELPKLVERGHQALAVMEQHLARHDWLVGDAFSIADIALFAYTHTAPEGGIELDRYPGILAWLERVRAVPGFVPELGPWP